MKHKRFEENILVDEAYTNYGKVDKNADEKKGSGIAKHFAETLEYEEKKKWYHQMPEEPSTVTKTLTQEEIDAVRREASSALHGDTLAYETKTNRNGSSDHQWAKTLLNKGAIGDRVAAATILIQDNPLYNLSALTNLINNVKPAKKKDGIVIIDALSELLVSELLIPDVKLRTLAQHPLGHLDEMTSGNKQARRNILKLWYYEDQLKELYGTYVEALNKFAHDSVEANKEKAVSSMSYLLMHHPEREKMLLTNVINKLGDPSQAVASKVIYHLCQLLYNHPNMKAVVLAEIEKMLFRTNIAARAQYYGVCFLNQFYLGKDDSRVADDLIRIYFSFFKASIRTGEIDSRLMSAILTGVKRAQPFTSGSQPARAADHVAAVHRLVHLAAPPVAVRALALLYHVSEDPAQADRYYSALYRKLASYDIIATSQSALFFSLIYKSMKRDSDSRRVAAFVKRLLQLCAFAAPAHACGILFLLSRVLRDADKRDAVRLVWTQRDLNEEVKDEPIEVKEQEENDTEEEEDKEEDKTTESVEEVKEEVKKVDLLRGDKKDLLLEDDEEESYVDLKIDEEGNIKPKKKLAKSTTPGWYHANMKTENGEDTQNDKELEKKIVLKKSINSERVVSRYSPLARNPRYAGAEHSAYVELLRLAEHFHPTVKLFASRLIHDQLIKYSGDPLKDFAGIRFLDRFVFKNPKKRDDNEDDDDDQLAGDGHVKKVKGSHPKFAVRKNYTAKGLKALPVTSSSYLNEDASKIPVDEKFLYDFLQKRRSAADQEDEDADSDADSVTSDDFNQYLDSVTGKKATESDEELDYLGEMESSKQQKKKKKKGEESDEDDQLGSDDDDDEDVDDEDIPGDDDASAGSDGELNISADEDEPALSGDEDELMLEGSDDEDDVIDVPGKKGKAGKGKLKLNLKGGEDLGSLFASAEEFSTLLEDNASNKKQGSSQAVSNKDNSSQKQLAWEDKRNNWIKGYNRKILGHKKAGKNKKFTKGKPQGKMADKKGAKRKADGMNSSGGKKKKFK